MKILYLCQRVPYPPDRGDRIVTYHQIRHLQQNHQVVVACLAHGGRNGTGKSWRAGLDVKLIAPRHSWFQKARGMLWSLSAGEPLTLGYFRNETLQNRIDAIHLHEFDAIIVFSSSMAQYVEKRSHPFRIMHFCDVDSQKWSDLAKNQRGPKRWIFEREGRLLLHYERRLAKEFALSCTVTPSEARLFEKQIPGIPVYVLENGVDVDYFSAIPRQPCGLSLVFVGVMDYPPNVEAVTYFADQVWPVVKAAHPKAQFKIVGARPSRAIRKLSRRPDIDVTGYVSDIRPYLSSATVMVAPLKVARGVQNKIQEAMAAGLPILTTEIVSRGLPGRAAELIFTAGREPEQYSSAILSLIENAEAREERAREAKIFVQNHSSWKSKLEALDLLLNAGK